MPSIRSVAKAFNHLSRAELDALYKASESFDVLSVVLVIYAERELTFSDWKRFKRWSKKIDNWAHSDSLSSMIATLVETYPQEIYADLQTWNKSKLPWQRRLSLTSLLYYSNARSRYLPSSKIFPLVKARLSDPDVYVQKAVGWALREAGNCYPEATETFIQKHVLELSSIAFSSATEKWTPIKKEPLKMLRKNARKQSK